jgi:hypothetical protein
MSNPRERGKADRHSRIRIWNWGPFAIHLKRHPGHSCVYGPFALMYATRSGGPILKTQPHKWMYINGALFHIRRGHVVFAFRRSFIK